MKKSLVLATLPDSAYFLTVGSQHIHRQIKMFNMQDHEQSDSTASSLFTGRVSIILFRIHYYYIPLVLHLNSSLPSPQGPAAAAMTF